MSPAMADAAICAAIGAAGTVASAWIDAWSRRLREDRTLPCGTDRPQCVTKADLAADRETPPDGER